MMALKQKGIDKKIFGMAAKSATVSVFPKQHLYNYCNDLHHSHF